MSMPCSSNFKTINRNVYFFALVEIQHSLSVAMNSEDEVTLRAKFKMEF